MLFNFLLQAEHDLSPAMIAALEQNGIHPWRKSIVPQNPSPDAHWPDPRVASIPLSVDADRPGEVPLLVSAALRGLLDVLPLLQPDDPPQPGKACVRIAVAF